MTDFISLHNHSDQSLLNSLASTRDLFLRAKELNQKAIAITDHGSFAAAWDGLKASKETGVKLIIGCEFHFLNDVSKDLSTNEDRVRHVILLAKNQIGYKNLLRLNREGFNNPLRFSNKVSSVIDWRLLEKYSEGVICLTACSNGILGQLLNAKKFQEAEEDLQKLIRIFGDNLGLEVQPNALKRPPSPYSEGVEQVFTNRHIINLGKKYNVKVVATSNAHYILKEHADIHDALLAIGSGQPKYSNARLKYDVPDFYLKSGEEVKAFFSRNYGDELAEEVCANSIYFADMCENPDWIDPKFSNPSGKELPDFPVKDEKNYHEFILWLSNQNESIQKLNEDQAYLRFRCEKNFDLFPKDQFDKYKERFETELETIYHCGISSYMLVVADYLNWARENSISIGPGRGSVAGCMVAYLLRIHEADPIKYGLVFQRFHNKLRVSYADIDCDVSNAGRDKVIGYLFSKYGSDYVAHVSNMNKVTPKVYVKDIARISQLGGDRQSAVKIGNDIADMLPKEATSFKSALSSSPLFAEYADKKYPEFLKYQAICGKPRAKSTHAGGIIISKRALTDLVPLRIDKDGSQAVEYDKDKAEENGLVKLDVLGVKNLDEIEHTFRLIKANGKQIPVIDYDVYDKKTYDLISSGNTFCVFQLGISAGTIDLCKKIKPKSIEELAIINSLARPSAKTIREDFIKTKNGEKKNKLIHPSLEGAFKETYGYALYDESLLILAKDVAGWDLGEADKLRKLTKAKGKEPEKAKKWKDDFIEGSIKNNIPLEIAHKIWIDIIEKYGLYSFNKSHAVVYSMISYQTAYLKAHFPIEFLLANLISEVESNAKIAKKNIEKIKEELKTYDIKIIPPDLNKSSMTYTIVPGTNKLITGLDAIKFVSDEAIPDIIEKRPFSSFFDFMVRVSSKKVRANTIQALAACGCLDEFGIPRKLIFLYVSDYRKKLTSWLKKHDPTKEVMEYPWPKESDWTVSEKFALEKYYMDEGFICGKSLAFGEFYETLGYMNLAEAKTYPDRKYLPSIKAEIKNIFEFRVKKEDSKYYGKNMVKIDLEDIKNDRCTLTIFPDKWEDVKARFKVLSKGKHKFEPGISIHFSATVNIYEDEPGLVIDSLINYAPPPVLPIDRKAKTVSMKKTKDSSEKVNDIYNPDKLLEEIEDQLFDEGLIDFPVEEDDE